MPFQLAVQYSNYVNALKVCTDALSQSSQLRFTAYVCICFVLRVALAGRLCDEFRLGPQFTASIIAVPLIQTVACGVSIFWEGQKKCNAIEVTSLSPPAYLSITIYGRPVPTQESDYYTAQIQLYVLFIVRHVVSCNYKQ